VRDRRHELALHGVELAQPVDERLHVGRHPVERARDDDDLLDPAALDPGAEVALAEPPRGAGELLDRIGHTRVDPAQQQRPHDRHHEAARGDGQHGEQPEQVLAPAELCDLLALRAAHAGQERLDPVDPPLALAGPDERVQLLAAAGALGGQRRLGEALAPRIEDRLDLREPRLLRRRLERPAEPGELALDPRQRRLVGLEEARLVDLLEAAQGALRGEHFAAQLLDQQQRPLVAPRPVPEALLEQEDAQPEGGDQQERRRLHDDPPPEYRAQRIRPAAKHPLIVVADNDDDILRLIAARLARRGYEVVAVGDGQQALAAARERSPDAVVLDWAMPGLEGPEVCARLKSDPGSARMPVVMLSASAMREDVARGLAHGADGYLTKPFEIDELDGMLRRLIEASR
jgi:CheY-like chemotaxis protein